MIAGNTYQKLKNGEDITIAFFGGSITEAGGTADRLCWRGFVVDELRRLYPDQKITEVNAGIGGTLSRLGVYRMGRDVIKYKPDLIFFEFCTNDAELNDYDVMRYHESCIMRAYKENPYVDFVPVYTITKQNYEIGKSSGKYTSDVAQKVYDHYKIPHINMAKVFFAAVESGTLWEDITHDNVHPNEKGHRLYFEYIKEAMPEFFGLKEAETKFEKVYMPSQPISENYIEKGMLYDAAKVLESGKAKGFKLVNETMFNRYPRYIEGDAGAELEVEFYGAEFGVFWVVAPDSGIIAYSVDGGEEKEKSAWDKFAKGFSRASEGVLVTLDDKLDKDAVHKIKIRVLKKHDEEATGCKIRIGAFLMQDKK